jgi:hypothetical protein
MQSQTPTSPAPSSQPVLSDGALRQNRVAAFDPKLAGTAGKHEKALYDFFRGQTLRGQPVSHEVAAAIMGGAHVESGGLNDEFVYAGGAYGIFQWRGSRQKNLFEYARRMGKLSRDARGRPVTDLQTQMQFLMAEMTEGHEFEDRASRRYVTRMVQGKTIEDAALAFTGVERPNSMGPDGKYDQLYNPSRPELTHHWDRRLEAAKRVGATYSRDSNPSRPRPR